MGGSGSSPAPVGLACRRCRGWESRAGAEENCSNGLAIPAPYKVQCISRGSWDGRRIGEVPRELLPHGGRAEPVRDWLRSLADEDRRIVGGDIARAEFGWPIGMPLCRSLGGGLWEVRSSLPHGRIARVIFCASQGHMVLLHGFEKKSQATPRADLELARRRQRETER